MPPDILSTRSRGVLASFVDAHVLIAFDFDGVLAPIVAARERAHLRVGTRTLLTSLAAQVPCIVVSGRQLSDLEPRLEGIPLRKIFGNFGHEPALDGHRPSPVVATWVKELEQHFSGQRGIVVENKGFSVAVHYRLSPAPDRARILIEDVMAGMPGGRILEGQMAVMLVPRAGPTKGSTLQAARRALGCPRAVYVGDDGTDEDAFASAPAEKLLSVRVGASRQTNARFQLNNQVDIDRFLKQLLIISRR
jgi:trehalose 6-phosphate phosphatase